jgi:dTDP-4-amino-4,6-dideoxygalactose transaminase
VDPEIFGYDRQALQQALEAENIESRPVWKPMHMQPVFNPLAAALGSAPVLGESRTHEARWVGGRISEFLFHHGLCLPSGTAMSKAELDRIIATIVSLHRS